MKFYNFLIRFLLIFINYRFFSNNSGFKYVLKNINFGKQDKKVKKYKKMKTSTLFVIACITMSAYAGHLENIFKEVYIYLHISYL